MPEATAEATPSRSTGIRRTPCVGICSTTYGDLVCRGCNRFAHEIVGWNSYDDEQRERIWARLHTLLAQSVLAVLEVVDPDRLRTAADRAKIPDADTLPLPVLAMRTMSKRPRPLAELGLAANDGASTSRDALGAIDREFHTRSRACYEMSFKTLT